MHFIAIHLITALDSAMAFKFYKIGVYANTVKDSTRFYFNLILGKDFEKNVISFRKNNGESLRYSYKFDKQDIVFDIGGFRGEFAEQIYRSNPCKIFVFEPVLEHFNFLTEKFAGNLDIRLFNFGLDAKNQKIEIALSSNSSSYNRKMGKNNLETIELKDIVEFLTEEKIDQIALMKINIEGAEYDLLDRLIESTDLKNVQNLQIQFHDFFPEAKSRRNKLVKQILLTHECTASFPMVWEFFKVRS